MMPHVTLIGIAGRARTGKDSLAGHLCRHHGYERIAFADPLRSGLDAMGIPWESLSHPGQKDAPIPWLGVSGRYLMQSLGDWGRTANPNYWICLLARRIDRMVQLDGHTHIVVTDVRYENEADWIREHGQLWHLRRPDAGRVRPHSSEDGIVPLPGEPEFTNDGTLADLYSHADAWLCRPASPA